MSSITTATELAALNTVANLLRPFDPEVAIVFCGGLTQHEDWLMSGHFTVRAKVGKLWLTCDGMHIGSWEQDAAGELALWIAVHSEQEQGALIS